MRLGVFLGNHAPNIGGSFSFQKNLIQALKNISTDHEVIVFGYDPDIGTGLNDRIKFVPLPKRSFLDRSISFVKRKLLKREWQPKQLNDYCKSHAIDIIWFMTHAFEPVSIPYICTILDIEHRVNPLFPELSNWQEREDYFSYAIPRASYVICGTQAGKKQVMDFYHANPERVKVVPFPAPAVPEQTDLTARQKLQAFGIDTEFLFYPAQFWPHKNHVCLLKALKLLKDTYSVDVQLVFSGADKGNMSYVREVAEELHVADRVRFIGFVSDEELVVLYKNAFALVYASFFGPDNLPPLEALAMGCPVIASHVAGAAEQMGSCAILVDPRRESEFAAAVMRLKNDSTLRDEMIRKGKDKALTWSALDYVSEIMKLVDDFELYRRCWSLHREYIQK